MIWVHMGKWTEMEPEWQPICGWEVPKDLFNGTKMEARWDENEKYRRTRGKPQRNRSGEGRKPPLPQLAEKGGFLLRSRDSMHF